MLFNIMLSSRCKKPLNSDNTCMSETKKPVGLRLTSKLWESLKQYGLQHHLSDKGKEGFDVTQTIESLLCQALGISLETSAPLSNTMSDDRLAEMIKQQLNDLLSPMLYDSVSDNQTDVSKLLNSQIIEIVDAKIGEVSTELKTYTQRQCDEVRDELKKLTGERITVTETLPIATAQTPQTKSQQQALPKQNRKPSELELPALQAVIDMSIESMSWGQFMRLVGLDPDEPKKASNADLALSIAAGLGVPISPKNSSLPGWFYTANKGFATR
jgi:hypothetical protein